jgi:drug/metabolite transporter (DMT)-like permease
MRLALIKLHVAVLLAGFTAILGRLISLGEASLVWWRLVLSVSALFIIFRWRTKPRLLRPRDRIKMLGIGMLVGLHWLCFFGSVKYGNVSVALITFSASGFFSAILQPVLLRRAVQPIELLLGLACIAGISIIFHFDARYKTGIALGVAAAALSALFSIFNKQVVSHQADGLYITFVEMTGALLVMTLVLPVYVLWRGDAFLPAGADWLWLLLLALACTVWAFFLQLQALQYISAVTLNLTYNLEPLYGIALAFALFHENEYWGTGFYAGFAIIAVAVAVQMARVRQGKG